MSTARNNLASTPKPTVTANAGQKRCPRATVALGWSWGNNNDKYSAIKYIPQWILGGGQVQAISSEALRILADVLPR
jgi:hypothetical protein